MQRTIAVKGRLINPRTVELDEPVSELTGDVEVVLRAVTGDSTFQGETIFEWLNMDSRELIRSPLPRMEGLAASTCSTWDHERYWRHATHAIADRRAPRR